MAIQPAKVEVLRDCSIPMDDGAELAADVYLPSGAAPCPALVTMLPYQKDGFAGILGWETYRHFAACGYASVLVDLRGLGGSGGRARPPFDSAEGADGAAVIAWVARQAWCDGAVGMWGASYGALTALWTAAKRPPALKAILPVVGAGGSDVELAHPAGVRGCMSVGVWSLLTLAQQLWPPLHQDTDGRWLQRWQQRLEHAEPYVIDLARRGPDHPSWQQRALDVSSIEVPTFCIGGWRDLFCDRTVRMYQDLRAPKKLLMGPWMHTLPDEARVAPVDFRSIALRWWDRWLRGEPNGIDREPPVTFYVQGRGTWHHVDDWPPPHSDPLTYHSHPDGRLSTSAGRGEAGRRIDPTIGAGAVLWGVPTGGLGAPDDQHDDDARSISFTSPPLEAPLEITGSPRATVALAARPCRLRTLVVKLAAVDPLGRSTLITFGTVAVPETSPVEIELYATSFEVPAGHRIRLAVATADFPRLWPDPSVGDFTVGCNETSLRLPTAPSPLDVATLPSRPEPVGGSELVLHGEPIYAVTRDRIDGAVQVEIGDHTTARTPDGLGLLEHTQRVRASVAPRHPEAAILTGTSTTTAQGRAGEIVVTAEILVRDGIAVASGRVIWDGQEIVTKRWTT